MFKREIKINFKSFIIWLSVLITLFLLVFLLYPSITGSDNIKSLDQMLEVMPKELLIAFNMDISSVNTAFGWIKTEGFVFLLLIIGSYSAILGSSILLKEESDKTIEYLNSLPIKRNDIIISKIIPGIIYITSLVIAIGIFNYIGLSLSGSFDKKQFILLSITPLFSSVVIYFTSMFLATFTNKTKKMLGVSLGIVMVSYMLQVLSTIAKPAEFLKYFSVFTLSDIRNVMINQSINPIMIFITVLLSIIFITLTVIRYNKKELI